MVALALYVDVEENYGRKLTMGVGVGDGAAHAQLRSALEETIGNKTVGLGDAVEGTEDSKDTVVNTRDNLADTSADASLVTKLGNILSSFADDDACFLRGDDGSQGDLSLGVLFICARR